MILLAAAVDAAEDGRRLSAPERTEFLQRLAEASPAGEAREMRFREARRLRALRDPVVSEGKLYFLPPDKFRREIERPAVSTAVSDGSKLWLYYPDFNEVERYDLSRRGPVADLMNAMTAALNFDGIERRFRVEVYEEEGGYRIELVPRAGALRGNTRLLAVRLDSALRLVSSDFISRSGERTFTEYFDQRAAAPSRKLFEFEPPPGARISEPLG